MKSLQGQDFLTLASLSSSELIELLDVADRLKDGSLTPRCDRVLGLLFYKASTRTRVSFTVAMQQMGGNVIDLNPGSTQVGRGEPLTDTARILDRYLDVLAIRTFAQSDLELFARYAKMPIINALTDLAHPCQILADLQTARACFGGLEGLTLAYVGDGNNVAHSLLLGCALAGMNVRIATPEAYRPSPDVVAKAQQLARPGTEIAILSDPVAAMSGAHVAYTDVWASMGQEDLAAERLPIFSPYQLNDELLGHADSQAIVLHCLPAHRGEEITDDVMEGPRSRVWDQAENRLHAQKALLVALLGLL
ncbi:MAG: ornithine carbamoyltransferase [Cyanobacteria bacterium J06641_5]